MRLLFSALWRLIGLLNYDVSLKDWLRLVIARV